VYLALSPSSLSQVALPDLKRSSPKQRPADVLLSTAASHRRIAEDGLEVGSFFFRSITLGSSSLVLSTATTRPRRFSLRDIVPGPDGAYFSLGLRSPTSLRTGQEYLVILGADGHVWHTQPKGRGWEF